MDCIIVAGGVPTPDDPLYGYTQGKPKALLDMNGRTMLEQVVDALQASRYVDDVVVVGLGDNMGMVFQRPVHHLPNQGGMLSNVLAGIDHICRQKPSTAHVLLSSADVPAITGPIVDAFVETCQPLDKALYYNFATKKVMEQRFPHSDRTYVKLKGLQVAGGDLIIAHAALGHQNRELWEALTNARKHAWRLARVVGIRFLIKFLLRQVSLRNIEETAERIIGRPAQAILTQHAEIAMDVDKPRQVEMLRADLGAAIF